MTLPGNSSDGSSLPDDQKKKKSKKQEEDLAESLGGMPVSGSGAGPTKGDVDLSDLKIEAKRTEYKSIRIAEKDIKKIKIEAHEAGKDWAIAVEVNGFESNVLPNEFFILPRYKFESLLSED